MQRKKIKFQRLGENGVLPTRGTPNSIGLDLYSAEDVSLPPLQRVVIATDISVEIPEGYYGRIAPRSGLAVNKGIDVLAGVVDSDYRGELGIVLINHSLDYFNISIGDKIAQLILERADILDPEWADTLEDTARGYQGFGSTGV